MFAGTYNEMRSERILYLSLTEKQAGPRPYVIKTWFKFEDKIQNTSKVIVFTRNHTNDDDDDADHRTKHNVSPGRRGGGDIILVIDLLVA